ncbi:MAG: hypothetical protein A2176_08035 [Spirochaetes bacterium RBG_13_51_14]|nr:MAG: hypothetical protein A2176_08035 [Spirochaetes bacterium RBG_13_51_14]
MRQSTAEALNDREFFGRNMLSDDYRLSQVEPSQRVLLLSHCLRSSSGCKAKLEAWGLECVECKPSCQINRLRRRALDLGYRAVCVAPGGSLALKFVKELAPRGIVAVACMRELEEGINIVRKLAELDTAAVPSIVVVPLSKEGCIDTEVNIELAFGKLSLGCPPAPGGR